MQQPATPLGCGCPTRQAVSDVNSCISTAKPLPTTPQPATRCGPSSTATPFAPPSATSSWRAPGNGSLKQRDWSLAKRDPCRALRRSGGLQRAPQAPLPAHRCRDERTAPDAARDEGARRRPHQRLRAPGRYWRRAPLRAARKTRGLHRAQSRPAPKRDRQKHQTRHGQKRPGDLRHLLIQGAHAVLRTGRATALGQWAGNSSPEKATAMSPSPLWPASSWSRSGTCSR